MFEYSEAQQWIPGQQQRQDMTFMDGCLHEPSGVDEASLSPQEHLVSARLSSNADV